MGLLYKLGVYRKPIYTVLAVCKHLVQTGDPPYLRVIHPQIQPNIDYIYIYIYIYMCVCVCIYVYIYTYIKFYKSKT